MQDQTEVSDMPRDLLPPGRNPLCKLRLSMGPSMDGVNVLMVQSTLPPSEIKSFQPRSFVEIVDSQATM